MWSLRVLRRARFLVPLVVLAMAATSARLTAQDEAPPVAALLEQLKDLIREGKDIPAIVVIGKLVEAFPKLEIEDEREDVADAVARCLNRRRREGDDDLYVAAVEAFASMGEEGRKATARALRHKTVKKRLKVLNAALLSLGSHAEPRSIKELCEFLTHREASVVSHAVDALGSYERVDERYRKQIVSELVDQYSTQHSLRLDRRHGGFFGHVRGAFETSLRKLTGQKINGAEAWRAWYNDHKRKRWKPPPQKGGGKVPG